MDKTLRQTSPPKAALAYAGLVTKSFSTNPAFDQGGVVRVAGFMQRSHADSELVVPVAMIEPHELERWPTAGIPGGQG
jgi:hypothetical protein